MDLGRLIAYDAWANNKIFATFSDVAGTDVFPEIRKLFAHLLAAQVVWLNRMEGKEQNMAVWPDMELEEIQELMETNPSRLTDVADKKDGIIHYSNSRGEVFTNTVDEILTHLMIHGQHHRAQIARLLREAGVKPPTTDLIFYLRTL